MSFLIIILATQSVDMALNYIWIALFITGFIVAIGQLIFVDNTQIFNEFDGFTTAVFVTYFFFISSVNELQINCRTDLSGRY